MTPKHDTPGDGPEVDRFSVPASVSSDAAMALKSAYGRLREMPRVAQPETLEEFDARNAERSAQWGAVGAALAENLRVEVSEMTLGPTRSVRLRPESPEAGAGPLVYMHGGGYVLLSAMTSLALPALVASATGREVVSVDYTLAPRGNSRKATDEVLSVWIALLDEGYAPGSIGFFGDSSGGGLAAGAILKIRDQGLQLPGALYLVSPWSDLSSGGDTYTTLAAADPILTIEMLESSARAYAAPAEQKHPYASPLYGDYGKPFPPTLIQAGTREIFLSQAVRLYQAVRAGGHEAILDVYEGMPHVHPLIVPFAHEGRIAIARAAEFLSRHLAP